MESMFGYISVLVCRLLGIAGALFKSTFIPISLAHSLRTGECCPNFYFEDCSYLFCLLSDILPYRTTKTA